MSSPICTSYEEEACVTIVKNTFISLQRDCPRESRRMSIPASLRLLMESPTEGESVCQKHKPRGYSNAPTAFGDEDAAMSPTRSDDKTRFSSSSCDRPDDKLSSSKSPPRDSVSLAEPPARSSVHTRQWRKVIKRATKQLQESGLVKYVQTLENSQACSLVLQMSAEGSSQKKRVLALAQKALLDAAVPSKSIYVAGYCSPNAFASIESGFEGTFVAMENATTACWHLFKKGTCGHGNACCRRHPVWAMPTRVFVEGEPRATEEEFGMTEMKVEC